MTLMICPNCNFESPIGMRFCGRCGFQLAQACPSCGFANPPDFLFCGMCGNPLQVDGNLFTLNSNQNGTTWLSQKDNNKEPFNGVTPIEGEKRVATVILADVTRSTDLLNRIGTEKWVGIMSQVFQLLNAEIYRYGGNVDQFRGDGLIAFFGTVVAHEDDPERAILSALAMQQALEDYSEALWEKEDIQIKLRIGINTGEVIVASIGSEHRHKEDTAMGEAVALAARMEEAADPGTILVSDNTYRLTVNRFDWQPLGEINVKGIQRPIAVYRPLSPRFDFEATMEYQSYGMPMFMMGREAELHTLINSIEGLYKGRGGIIMVVGEKGLGKSLLVTYVRDHFTRLVSAESSKGENELSINSKMAGLEETPKLSGIAWYRCSCRSYDQGWPFLVWQDLLHQWLGIRPDQPALDKQRLLKTRAFELWGDSFEKIYPYLATFLSIPLEEEYHERVRHLDAVSLKKQMFLAVRSWVEELANHHPLVLSFADLQWIDIASLELLKYCLPLTDHKPVIWLTIFRPDQASLAWEFNHYVETNFPHRLTCIDLKPFSVDESKEIIYQVVGKGVLSEKTVDLIVSKSEGNPYFIREIVSSLISQGVIVQDTGTLKWQEKRSITSLDLPDSLQSLLLERLDRLPINERRILQTASVMGLYFWYEVLVFTLEDTLPVSLLLTSLLRRGIIRERESTVGLGMEYSFNSALVRDVLYDSMLDGQKRNYHRKVATFIEEKTDLDNLLPFSNMIAYHFRCAGDRGKELFYTLKSADQARKVYANVEAMERLSRALEIIEELQIKATDQTQNEVIESHRFEVFLERCELNQLLGHYQDAMSDARALLPIADKLNYDPRWRADALVRQPEVQAPSNPQMVEQGLRMASEALEIAIKQNDRNRELQALFLIAGLQKKRRLSDWKQKYEQALKLAEYLGDIKIQVKIILEIASAYGIDEIKTNLEYLEKAKVLCKVLNDKSIELALLRSFAEQYERSGDYYQQLSQYEKKRLEISREIGDRVAEANSLIFSGQVQAIYLGDWEGGLALLEEALSLSEGSSEILFSYLRIAQVQIAIGDFRKAEKTLQKALPHAQKSIQDIGRAGFALVSAIFHNQFDTEEHINQALHHIDEVKKLVLDKLVSRQYHMAANCEETTSYLKLANLVTSENDRKIYHAKALEASQSALSIYNEFGFVQVIECSSQEILFRQFQVYKFINENEKAYQYLGDAYREIQRKYELIPEKTPYKKTFLTNIKLHREIVELFRATETAE